MAYNEHRAVGKTDSMYPPSDLSSGFPPPYANPDQAPPFTAPPPNNNQYPPYPTPADAQPPPPPPAGQPYYYQQPPGAAYGVPQHQVIVVGAQQVAPNVVYVNSETKVSMAGAIVLSCFVYWCCGYLLGGIAFILAMVGMSSAASGDRRGAIQMRNASYGLSIAGIVITVIIIAIVFGIVGPNIARGYYYYTNYNYNNYYYTNYYYTYYYTYYYRYYYGRK